MWLSTKRKRNDGLAPTPEVGLTTTSNAMRPGEDWKSSLPLDWTRMHCRRRRGRNSVVSKGTTTNTRSENGVVVKAETTPNQFDGRAIFCLHDDDPNWIQGYFIPKGSKKPWGMLAVQEEVDDCLACSMGGYRRLSLTVYHHSQDQKLPSSSKNHSDDVGSADTGRKTSSGKKKSCKIDDVDWTGGDMMSLHHPLYVDMQAEILLTVSCRVPYHTREVVSSDSVLHPGLWNDIVYVGNYSNFMSNFCIH